MCKSLYINIANTTGVHIAKGFLMGSMAGPWTILHPNWQEVAYGGRFSVIEHVGDVFLILCQSLIGEPPSEDQCRVSLQLMEAEHQHVR